METEAKLSREHSTFILQQKRKTKLSETEPPSKVVLLESGEGSDQCLENITISTVILKIVTFFTILTVILLMQNAKMINIKINHLNK